MRNTITLFSFFLIVMLSFQSKSLDAQSACCPDFYLSDAVDVCPPEGACIHDGTDPVGQNFITPMAACKITNHKYTVFPNDPTFTYSWTVSGGTPSSTSGNPVTILWGTGTQGVITVIVSNLAAGGNCVDTIVETICLIDGPQADFAMSDDTICVSDVVSFTNLSLGGSVFFWDFGDGTTSSFPVPPPHSFPAPGTYTVVLTVQDMGAGQWVISSTGNGETLVPCGCIDTISKTVIVLPGEGPVIDTDCCYGTVCAGDTSSFCTSMACSSYLWSVTGGNIISGAGTNCITVQWNNIYTVPTTVTLQSCPSMACQGSTTLNVPVLYPNLPINGPTTLCVGSSGSFSLPTLPGTYYKWTVTGGSYTFNKADRNVPLVNITFNTMGSYWVKCELMNPLAGCNGVDSILVDVLPIFSVFGPEKVCEGDIISYSASDPSNWTITGVGPTIQSGQGTSTVNVLWTPGNYVITANVINTSAFCNPSASKNVEVIALPLLNTIAGPDSICPGNNLVYSITSNTSGSPFVWTISSGTGTILSQMGDDMDSVVVNFTNPGPWTLDVYQEIEISPGVYCQSLTQSKVIYPFSAPSISGISPVCIDAIETYTASGSGAPGNYQWSISPSNQGTIQSGQGTPSVNIKWHGPPTTATLTVSNCSGSSSMSIVINGPPNVIATYNMTPVFCLGSFNTLVLSTPYGLGYSYQWYKDGVPVPGGNSFNLAVNTLAFVTPGTYQYYVIVTLNGCSAKSNNINVVIQDCTNQGGGTGQCDLIAFITQYVVCYQETLINSSNAIAPATITSYNWSLSGPGTGTFLPSATAPAPTLTVSASGLYTLTLTITSSTGCISTWSAQFNVLLPVANFSFTSPVCENSPAYFNAIPNNPNFTYFWNFGDGFTSYDGATEHAYSVASPPVYNVTLTITDDMGCIATGSNPVTVNPAPNCTLTASDTTICPGDFAVLTTCSGSYVYKWYLNGIAIPGAAANTYNAYEYGEYTVEIVNSYGCSIISNSVFIYINSLPYANITGNGLQCADAGGYAGFFLNTTFNTNYTYSWTSNPAGASFSPSTGNNPWVSFTLPVVLPVVYDFIVNVTDITTGCINADTFCVTFFENPPLSVAFQSACEGDSIYLVPTPNDQTLYGYQWSNGATTPAITAKAAGLYTLTITDLETGCTNSVLGGSISPLPDLSLFPTGCMNICDPDSLHLYLPLALNAQWPNNTYPSAYPVITWYDNGDYTTSIGSGPTLDLPSTNSGSHQISVVVTNSFGCSDTAGVFCLQDECCNIVIENVAVHNTSCPEVPDGWITIVLDPSTTGGPFSITSSPGLPGLPSTILPGVPFNIVGVLPGSYVITISNTSGDCTYTINATIMADDENCCFAKTDSSFTKILSNVTYSSDMVWDGKYYIDNGVIVTVTNGAVLDVTVVDVVFGECAGIVFQNGGRLRATNSVFRPCEIDGNWKGLLFNGPGEFDNIINESTFKNAEAALYFINGSDAVISNNLFSNCNMSIRVEGNNNFSHPISGNRFVTDNFFPNFSCTTKYTFVSNSSSYGIYSTGSRFIDQVSHNQFIDAKQNGNPRTYGIYQTLGGGIYSQNTFTDMYSSVWLQSAQFYTAVENSNFELNSQPVSWFPTVYISGCNGPVIEVNNNEIINNYNQFTGYVSVYATSSQNISIVDNDIEGFYFGILLSLTKNFQVSYNEIQNALSYGIFINEQANSRSYVTCNTIKMKNFSGTGLLAYNMSSLSEVSSNCVNDCYISMDFRGFPIAGSNPVLPLIRNNYLYNYTTAGINVQGLGGNIGTATDPGMNTFYSNRNTAIDINSTSTIYVANNFGMFNISFPQVQITANNPYHSTASCGHQIFNMPSQGNLNTNYICDHFVNISSPLTISGGSFKLMENYLDLLSVDNLFNEVNMILSTLGTSDVDLMNKIIAQTALSENEKALLKYGFYSRNSDFAEARVYLNMFTPADDDQEDYKLLSGYYLNYLEQGQSALENTDYSLLTNIIDKGSVNSNLAITLMNTNQTYQDHLVFEPEIKDAEISDNIKYIDETSNYLNIYPNPTSGKVVVELIAGDSEGSSLEIYDVTGKKVEDYTLNLVSGVFELDVSNMGEGFYFITLTDNTGFVQKGKLVKVNP